MNNFGIEFSNGRYFSIQRVSGGLKIARRERSSENDLGELNTFYPNEEEAVFLNRAYNQRKSSLVVAEVPQITSENHQTTVMDNSSRPSYLPVSDAVEVHKNDYGYQVVGSGSDERCIGSQDKNFGSIILPENNLTNIESILFNDDPFPKLTNIIIDKKN